MESNKNNETLFALIVGGLIALTISLFALGGLPGQVPAAYSAATTRSH